MEKDKGFKLELLYNDQQLLHLNLSPDFLANIWQWIITLKNCRKGKADDV